MTQAFTEMPSVSLTIDGVTFDRYHYDEDADSLCFHTGPAAWAVDFDETVEDHHLRYDADGALLSITILNARLLLNRDGAIEVTLREGGPTTRLERELVEPLLTETLRY
jgi:uncharacterized protein YuzE